MHPDGYPPMGSAPAFVADSAEASRRLKYQTWGRCGPSNTHQLCRRRQPPAAGLPPPFSSALLPRGGMWPGRTCHPLLSYISICGHCASHGPCFETWTQLLCAAGQVGALRDTGLKWCVSVWREASVLIYRILKNIQALDVTQTLQHVAGSFGDSWPERGLSCGYCGL